MLNQPQYHKRQVPFTQVYRCFLESLSGPVSLEHASTVPHTCYSAPTDAHAHAHTYTTSRQFLLQMTSKGRPYLENFSEIIMTNGI